MLGSGTEVGVVVAPAAGGLLAGLWSMRRGAPVVGGVRVAANDVVGVLIGFPLVSVGLGGAP